MRKFSAVLLSLVLVSWNWCPFGGREQPVDPNAVVQEDVNYIITFWDVELPPVLAADAYRERTEEIVRDFNALKPNITVEMRWLPWDQAQAELERALKNGVPPDLYADWQGIAKYNHTLQIPAELYLGDVLTPAAERGVTRQGERWAWPRFIWPAGLLALRSDLPVGDSELDRLLERGWTWAELEDWLLEHNLQIIVNDYQGRFSGQLLQAATGRGLSRPPGPQEVFDILSRVEKLRDLRLLQSGGIEEIQRGSTILGGAGMPTGFWLSEYFDEHLVLLPLPGIGENRYYPVTVLSLLHFRQARYQGDDHSRAVAQAAEYLSREQAARLGNMFYSAPAFADLDWDSAGLPAWQYSFLTDAARLGTPQEAVDNQTRQQEKRFREELNSVLVSFWDGKVDAATVAQWILDHGGESE
ncbi:MAG: hypothetical protein FH749_15520 [Firmicutes bacterium]|nr:hypothetical protein [Bacillota bacterium]